MQVQKEDVKVRIRQSALAEFYEKGYKFATMREIAKNAKIPTGLIYNYYKNKEALLEDIVAPAFTFMEVNFFTPPQVPYTHDEFLNIKQRDTEKIIQLTMNFKKELVILAKKAKGSKFENAKEEIINNLTKHLELAYIALYGSDYGERYGHSFPRLISACYVEGVLTIAENITDYEESKFHILRLIDLLYCKESH